ncbi:hypothetical protein [Pseudooceanicola marinus]|uniref:hypothetical protein n=1 Tax=Pseudooceanicola marinus TaxID=396013 RepID=UPI001CD42F5B|nr:hypothetical protein [Pseudooceanicola marinus]MCA1337371.1 hypothetical protein [Pseudooceanicola marinus]
MATQKHPLTGVTVNELGFTRKSMTFEDAVTAFILRLQGRTVTEMVRIMGISSWRISEVIGGVVHPGAEAEAVKRLREKNLILL